MAINNFNVGVGTTSQLTRYRYVATGGETSISGADADGKTLSYTVGLEQVYLNGVNLVRGQDYTATNGTSIGSLTALVASDVVEVFAFVPFNIANAVTASTVDAKGDLLVGTAADTVGRLAVGTNGQTLIANSAASTGLKYSPVVAFDVYFNGVQTISTATFTKVTLNTENYDTNNNFDPTTNYRFTPTVAGYYQFSAWTDWSSANAGNQMIIRKNNDTGAITSIFSNNGTDEWNAASGLLYMNGTTDYVELVAAHLAGSNRDLQTARLTGILVREA